MEFRKLITLIMACGLLLSSAGCSEDDIADILNLPDPQDDPVAQVMVAEGANMAGDVLNQIDDWAQGNLGEPLKSDPEWDPGCNCWRWTEKDGDTSDPHDWWNRNWNFAVTFFQGETPQMEFAGADSITAEIGYSYADGLYVDETDNSNRSLFFNLFLEVTDFLTGTINVSGGGSGTVQVYIVDGEDFTEFYESIDIAVQLSLPIGGCPTGTMTFTMGTTEFLINFNGSTIASWTFTPDGNPDLAFNGTFNLGCGG